MLESRSWHEDLSVRRTIDSLSRNGFEAIYLGSKEEALLRVLDLVPADAVVGLGGSVTLREMGLPEALRARGNTVADHWEARRRGASGEEVLGVRRQQLNSDVFITSTNAITETGALVNIDGGGQRVAAMIFGPRKVIVVAGVNKITGDVEGGLHRARNVAAPMNAKRLDRRTPCTSTGACSDCDSEDRICSVTTIIHRRPRDTDTTIIIVDEKLGY
jgi:L-lactate utilization protein LutB